MILELLQMVQHCVLQVCDIVNDVPVAWVTDRSIQKYQGTKTCLNSEALLH